MEREQKWFVMFILLVIGLLAGLDSLLERRIWGDMSIPFFLILVGFSLLQKEIGSQLFQRDVWRLWLVGITLVAALIALLQFSLHYAYDSIFFTAVALWLTVMVSVLDCWLKSTVREKTVFQFLRFLLRAAAIVLCLLSLIQNSKYLLMLYTLLLFCCAGCQLMQIKKM